MLDICPVSQDDVSAADVTAASVNAYFDADEVDSALLNFLVIALLIAQE